VPSSASGRSACGISNTSLHQWTPSEVEFDQTLGQIRGSVLEHERRITPDSWDDARGAHLTVLKQAISQVQVLEPPSPDWRRLSESFIRVLEFDAEVYGASRTADSTTGAASFARWEQLKRDWDTVRAARSRFMR
jgi:hypothetical protein